MSSFAVGTYMGSSMVHYLKAAKMKRTVIDELILSEQTVNIFAGLYIILILLRLTVPSSQGSFQI